MSRCRHLSVNIACSALVAATGLPLVSGRAQDVSGVVRDSLTGDPVRGAIVMLLAGPRDTLARVLTGSSGAFRLGRIADGRLRVIRIGYLPLETVLPPNDAVVSLTLVPFGTRLPAIAVSTSPSCPRRADQGEALALWSAATDGLLAMLIATTSDEQSDSVTQILFDRLLGGDRRTVIRQRVERVITGNVAPIRAERPPADFARRGYVLRSTASTTFYGPDPATLLDSSFAATHCLSLRIDSRNHPGEVGIAFAPSGGRDTIPDIAGVLWLVREPLALKSLEFEYRGVDRAIRDVRSGGRLEFQNLENGVPIIHSWSLRTPELAYLPQGRRTGRSVQPTGDLASVINLHETGGRIASGRLADGTEWSAPLVTLAGQVRNSTSGEPVARATVTFDSTDYRAITDGGGRFTVDGVLPGPYVARVRDSVAILTMIPDSAASLRADATVQQVVTREATIRIDARLDRTDAVDIRLPWREPIPGCGERGRSEQRFTVVGFVITPDSVPLSFARVRLAWGDTTRSGTSLTRVDAETDEAGFFLVCGVPGGRALQYTVRSPAGTEYAGRATVPLVDSGASARERGSNLRRTTIVVAATSRFERP